MLVAAHCELAPEARARVAAFEALGGAVLEGGDVVPLDEGAFPATLARAQGAPRVLPSKPERRTFPKALRDLVGSDPENVRWKAVGGGVKQAVLLRDWKASLRLLSIPAGKVLPEHGHRGLEMTLVLKGAFSDGDQRFGRGDIEIADPSDQHIPVAEPGEDCICLAATDAPCAADRKVGTAAYADLKRRRAVSVRRRDAGQNPAHPASCPHSDRAV